MCLDRLCMTSFWPIAIADLLSLRTSTGVTPCCTPSSVSSFLLHMAPWTAEQMDMYSASQDDSATVSCFLQLQSMMELPRVMIQPVVDLRVSVHPAQLASAYTSKHLHTNYYQQ